MPAWSVQRCPVTSVRVLLVALSCCHSPSKVATRSASAVRLPAGSIYFVVVRDTALPALAPEDCPNPSLSFSELCTGEAALQYTVLEIVLGPVNER
jgi:hypothetical protein